MKTVHKIVMFLDALLFVITCAIALFSKLNNLQTLFWVMVGLSAGLLLLGVSYIIFIKVKELYDTLAVYKSTINRNADALATIRDMIINKDWEGASLIVEVGHLQTEKEIIEQVKKERGLE